MTERFFWTKTTHLYFQFISTKVRIKDVVCVEVLPCYSYSKKSAILLSFDSVLFESNILHNLCYLLLFFEMLSCDYAVCFEIFDDWNLFQLSTDGFLTVFCTWDSNAHIMLIYLGILLFSPHLIKNKPWLHFKSFIFSFLKEGAQYMQKENKGLHKIDSYFSHFDKKCLFSIIRSILSQICYSKFWFWTKLFQIFSFFMSDDVKIRYTKKHGHIYMSNFLRWYSVFS